MARRGKFGRLPRQAPDLTGALVALIREAAAQVDSNLVDAWKNGGEVDGKAATDERLLKHFKMRRDQLSPDDPLWDEWDNRVKQYTFSIDESKLMVKWENQQVKEGDVRNFYRSWMAKTPKNTEFYRELARNAGKWGAAARAAGRARGGGRRAANNDQWETNYFNKHIAAGQIVSEALVFIAKQYGVMKPDGNSLGAVLPNSAAYGNFLDVLDGGAASDPAVAALIADAVKQVKKYDPDFEWTKQGIREQLDKSEKGAGVLAGKARLKTTRNQMNDLRANFQYNTARINDADEIEISFIAGDKYQRALYSCAGDPFCEKQALVNLRDTLQVQQATLVQTMANTNVELTGPIGQTIREANDILAGKTPEDTGFWSIFDMQGLTDDNKQDLLTQRGTYAMQSITLLEQGGWVSYVDGPLGSDGMPISVMQVNKPTDPPPMGSVEVRGAGRVEQRDANGVLTGTAAPVRAYITPNRVEGMAIDPNTGVADPNSTQRLYDTIVMPDNDGNRITFYRVDDPAGGPAVFTLDKPTFENGTEKTVVGQNGVSFVVTTFPAAGTAKVPGSSQPVATFAPVSNIPALVMKDEKGQYVNGAYATIDGARAGAIVEKAFIDVTPDVMKEGYKSEAYKAAVRTSADALNDTFFAASTAMANAKTPDEVAAAQAMRADAMSAYKQQQIFMTGKVGSYFIEDKDPEQVAEERRLYGMGITPERMGKDEYESRSRLLSQLDSWEEQHASASRERGFGGGDSPYDRFLAERDAARRQLSDPGVNTKDIVLPGQNPLLRGVPQDQRIGDSAVLTGFGALASAIGGVMAPWFPTTKPAGVTGPYQFPASTAPVPTGTGISAPQAHVLDTNPANNQPSQSPNFGQSNYSAPSTAPPPINTSTGSIGFTAPTPTPEPDTPDINPWTGFTMPSYNTEPAYTGRTDRPGSQHR